MLEWREIMTEVSAVTVRLIQEQTEWSATVRTRSNAEIELDPSAEMVGLQTGALVEIESLDTLCLGQVVLIDGTTVLVVVNHAVDLHKLARIQEVWHAPKE
jgi:hypothetical protein